ncbi:BTAD domain-containing putative transcriptional regulator [Streptomyces sp. JW3]|uniref:AfsR/SARP family transcriptional regulator n=1 Tax=Streptomyces sp. JW3 TaxID=3456955 RepID=UPI003FA40F76
MKFGLLGPLEAEFANTHLPIRGGRRGALLATLLVNPNRTVSIGGLLSAIWPAEPPTSALANIRTYVYELRRQLRRADGSKDRLSSRPEGYRLTVDTDELDLLRFRSLAEAGRRTAEHGDHRAAEECCERALRMWRGRPAEGLELGHSLTAKLTALEEERWSVASGRMDALLALGRHAQAVSGLRGMTAERPLCERTWAQLMIALDGDGRSAEALAAYRQARAVLVEEIAVEPGAELQRLHAAILRGEALNTAPQRPPDGPPYRPAEVRLLDSASCNLPPRPPHLVGRGDELRRLDAVAASFDDDHSRPDAAVVSLSGPPGVGKTATALAAAYRLRHHFPQAQLFASFDGTGDAPRSSTDVIPELLGALGLPPSAIPASPYEQQALFRSMIADRRTLIVLDDVAHTAQIRPLLPGIGRCLVLVTSRPSLVDLDADVHLSLPLLTRSGSAQLLTALVGQERVDAEPREAARVADACDGLPLALRIAGARLAARPALSLSTMARSLSDERTRLNELVEGDLSVRERLAESFRVLDSATRDVFCRLSGADAATVTVDSLQDELGLPEAVAENVLHELARYHFLLPVGEGPPRHRVPDLCRAFARTSPGGGNAPAAEGHACLPNRSRSWQR